MVDMRVRRIARTKQDNGSIKKEVVWFGSAGIRNDNSTIFFNENDKHDNFATEQEYVADSLTQKLSILEHELWWNVSYGLPLIEKINSKIALDATIMDIISNQEGVENILIFDSGMKGHSYFAHVEIESKYGIIILDI